MRAARKRVTCRRHVDLVPTVSAAALTIHTWRRAAELRAQRYQTGPRYGQELADARKAVHS